MLKKVESENDIKLLIKLADEIWHKYYPSIIGENQVEYMLKKFYDAWYIFDRINKGEENYFLIEDNERYVGFVSFSEPFETYFIHKFYLHPDLHGTGIAAKTMKKLFDDYFRNKSKPVKLTVNRYNIRAINFYFKMGFIIEKVADFDIGNGFFMNDFVMVHRRC